MKVLLGIGGSEDSYHALERTVERAAVADDELTVAIVENPNSDATPEEIETRVRNQLEAANVDADVRHVEGDPGSSLVDLAESGGFDQLVLGGGQRSPMGKISIGSIAEFVLLNSHKTVKLVR
ncbi:universal stress protein UspA [Haloprofundus marisrubri]|uniref:Universal stress protein UspA n=1 Tax=Haloprofundus marisrubri TaxID=1514971 RepID=A0A0W1R5P3_9EURY|nr:universal stress protein [Haloprofundus marisrubri]KTG08762.1 universal stress protein UspA [Haloprofundus marisrubri]